MQLSFSNARESTQPVPQTPYLTPQRDSMASTASTLTLLSEKKDMESEVQRIMDAEDEEMKERHPLDPPDYALEDLPNTKANSILYQEFDNRTEKVLLQPNVEDHLRRSKQRIKWAKIGGGGTCSLRLIDDLSRRIQFLEQCLKARKALTEGKYTAEVLKVKHDDLVWLEKNIGGFWAQPRRVGKEWRYLPQNAINELATEPEMLDELEEFMIVNDILHTIISSTGLCNLLFFGSKFPKKRNGYFEDRLMREYTWFNQNSIHEDDILYGVDEDIAPSWIYEPETMKARSTIVNEFVAASLPNLVKEGKVDVEINSWSDDVFEVDLDGEPRPLSFREKDHLAQRALALKDYLRYLLSNNAVLQHAGTKIHEYATVVGPSGVNIGFHAHGRTDGGFVFPTPQTDDNGFPLWTGKKFRDMWDGWRYPEEINHRGGVFDVLREEFRHAIQCWWYLWQKYGKDIKEYLFERQGAEVRGDGEVARDRGEEMVVEEPAFDDEGDTTLEETTLDDEANFGGPIANFSDNHQTTSGKNDMHFQITSLTTAEVIHDSGDVESFSIEEDPFMEIFMSSPPPSSSQEPTVKPSQKHQIDEGTEAPTPKRQKTSYLHKYDIHPSHLDGASRVCPETGETWWADAPPYFMFRETPTMTKVISDQMKENLRKGMLFVYVVVVSANFE